MLRFQKQHFKGKCGELTYVKIRTFPRKTSYYLKYLSRSPLRALPCLASSRQVARIGIGLN